MQAYELLIGKTISYGDGDFPEKALIIGCKINLRFSQNSIFLVQYEDGKKGELSLETGLAGIIQNDSLR